MIGAKIENQTIPIALEIKEYIGTVCPEEYNQYEGEYVVIPKTNSQELKTKNKMMKDYVTIEQIPFHEFSNETGTTVVIGGIL